MISENQLPELKTYRKIEQRLPFHCEPEHRLPVSSRGNCDLPGHRWFRFKESFSADLLKSIVEQYGANLGTTIRFLDPFCGVGTSLLAGQELSAFGIRLEATGIERNPFIAFVARTKVSWPAIEADAILGMARNLLGRSPQLRSVLPRLSSIREGRCISPHFARRIVALRDIIQTHGRSLAHDAMLLGLASAIEPVSRIRKDGRALRIVRKPRANLSRILAGRWDIICRDVRFLQSTLPTRSIPTILVGDGRMPRQYGFRPHSLDLIVTSPPYLNNIDYTEVYKLELWLLGFVQDVDSFLRLRYSTFRSHPTSTMPKLCDPFAAEVKSGALRPLLAPLLARVENMPRRWRGRVLIGYFADMWRSVEQFYECLRPGGLAVLIVGNSLHDGAGDPYLVPADLVVATIGSRVGFKVETVAAVRGFKRRLSGNHFLRESVVVLKKPNGAA